MKKVRVIAGPTASGKSSVALAEARATNGVIINADSLQIYIDLPTLTARPTAEETAFVPHHLYGFLEAEEEMNAQSWAEQATQEINNAFGKGQTPYIVGGTGFYLKTLFEGLSPIPEIAPEFRDKVMALYDEKGLPWCYEELERIDPKRAEALAPPDKQRILRALEVYYGTGNPISYYLTLPKQKTHDGLMFEVTLIQPPLEALYKACDGRFLKMLDMGGWAEAEELHNRIGSGEISPDAPITRALGFEEISLCLSGQLTRAEAIEKAQQKTRNYAKRQMTWFRNQLKPAENISVIIK